MHVELEADLQRLFRRNLHTVKLDLGPMRALMDLLGNPQEQLLFVHVAGTNGKGSVCAMMASILREQGYKTGLYTSPHLVRFNERIQINGEVISDATLKELIADVEAASVRLPEAGQRDVTFFEFTTALAFLYFARQKTEIVVLETGMGGRLDATNIVIPAISIITSIGFDHMAYLGDTLELIAGEKAGIIKKGRPVITGDLPEIALEVMSKRARSLGAPLRKASDLINAAVKSTKLDGQTIHVTSVREDYGSIKMKMCGPHQAGNTALAVAAAECLDEEVGVAISTQAIKRGLAHAFWPARNHVLKSDPPVVLDGAHNPEAAEALAAWIKKIRAKKPIGMVVGFLSDKDPAACMQPFHGMARDVWIVPLHNERAMPVDEVARRLRDFPRVRIEQELTRAIQQAEDWALKENGLVLITGSLYLAGEVLSL